MKIIGYSDVITNSSSEVFVVYTREGLNEIKEIINSILSLTSNKTFDDYFEISLNVDPEEVQDKCNISTEEFEKMSKEEVEDLALGKYPDYPDTWGPRVYPYIEGWTIKAKDDKYKGVAKQLNNIDNIFKKIAYFNG